LEPFVSIIIPSKNSGDILENCLESLRNLDYPQNRMEIILGDGLSTDNTLAVAEKYGTKVALDHNTSVVSGRNAAFKVARGELIAFSDDDCTMERCWLKNCLKYFEDDSVAGVGGPNLVPPDETSFGRAVALVFDYAPYITKAAHTRILNEVIESRSHGSNAIYRADVLHKVMPVDESLIGGEDVIMNEEIEDLGYKLLYVPDVIVHHYRRQTIHKWWHQMYRYGMGRVLLPRKRAGNLHWAHLLAGLSIPLLLMLTIVLAVIDPWFILALAGFLVLLAIISFSLAFYATRSAMVGLNMPLVLTVFFAAWSMGFLHELFFPYKGQKKRSAK
jgi:cellulose synthase/poly-beta-1,6-N-acetylglucosamine synthase-like glycosyltransferase